MEVGNAVLKHKQDAKNEKYTELPIYITGKNISYTHRPSVAHQSYSLFKTTVKRDNKT